MKNWRGSNNPLAETGDYRRGLPPDDEHELAVVEITATVRMTGKTGVEMEALTAVAVAGLTIYDMCKAVDRGMRLEAVRLVHKRGGKSGEWSGE